MAGIRDSISAGSSSKINFANLILRILQVLLGIMLVGFFASAFSSSLNKSATGLGDYTLEHKLTLGVTAGSLSIITAIAFALIPALVSYYYVAIAFVWEWIIVFLWCAVFGWIRYAVPVAAVAGDKDITNLPRFSWVVLVDLLLWLATAIMSIVCLLHDRKGLRFGRSGV